MSPGNATIHASEIGGRRFVFPRYFCALIFLLVGLIIARGERLPVKIYTSADGLGSSFVNASMRDSRGFLWFATRDGLSRFDGREFTTYQIGEKDAPPGIEQILETRDGIYWIATTGGLYRFDPKESASAPPSASGERTILNAELVGSSYRGALYEDSRGNLWIGNSAPYLIEQRDGKFGLRKIEIKLPDEKWESYGISGFAETADGSFWITTTRGMIRRLPDERLVFYTVETPAKDNLNASLVDETGRVWLGLGSAVYIFKAESPEQFPAGESVFVRHIDSRTPTLLAEDSPLPEAADAVFKFAADKADYRFRRIFRSSNGHIWIAAIKSLIEFDGQRWRFFDKSHGLTAEIIDIVEDSGGNLWLSGQSGVTRLNRLGMTAYGTDDGLGAPAVHSLFVRNGDLYAVSGSFVSRFNGKSFDTVRLAVEPNAIFLWTSTVGFPDSAGQWWILTAGKLYRFAAPKNFLDLAGQKPLAVYTDGLKGKRFYRMFEDSQKNLWISTHESEERDSGLTLWNRETEQFRIFSESDGLAAEKSLASFAEDAAGNFWLGFYQGGLARFRNGIFTELKGDDLPKGFITALHFDRKGHLWLASSQSGVSRIDEPNAEQLNFVRFTTENGLSSNNVRSLGEAENGDIYIGTARGVDRISPDSGLVRHFSTNDGLTGDFVVATARDAEGALWFGTSNGLSRFKPEPEKQKNLPPVWFSGLRVAGERRFVSELGSAEIEKLQLAPNENNLQIDFFAVDFSAGGTLRYQHKLEGADTDWSAATEERTVNYSNLAPGAYRFLVRAVSADGTATGEQVATAVSFNILAPFWRRWWFIAAVVLLFAAGVFALDRFRVKKTREVGEALDASRKSEQAARESETRYRTLAQTASDAIITIDEDSRIIYVNEAVEAIFGYTAAELVGENLVKLMPEAMRPRHENGVHRYLSTRRKNIGWATIELPGQHKSGREIPLELSFGEFEQDGQKFFTGIARDVTERKRTEAALQKSREERLAELERVRSRIARDLHDDVGSSLTQIALFSEVARQDGNGTGSESLDFIASTANELVESMSDIVWAINPQKDHLHDLTQRMRRFASEIFTAADIDLEFRTPEAEFDAPLGANLRREVFLIFKESVNNIVRHAGASAVEIEFTIENGFLILTLKDDGRGFDSSAETGGQYDWKASKGGNGLPGMKKRGSELGGEFFVRSKPGNGTTVTLRVPLEKT